MFHKTTCMISTYTPQWLSPTQTHTHTQSLARKRTLSHTQATKLSLVFRCVYVLFLRQELFAASLSFVLLNPQSALLFSWQLARTCSVAQAWKRDALISGTCLWQVTGITYTQCRQGRLSWHTFGSGRAGGWMNGVLAAVGRRLSVVRLLLTVG